jgi:YjzC-like protein
LNTPAQKTENSPTSADDDLVEVVVSIPANKVAALTEFAAGLRGEHPYIFAIFPHRPPSDARTVLKTHGLKYIDRAWQGSVPRSRLASLRHVVELAGGRLGAEAPPIDETRRINRDIAWTKLDDIKKYSPYSPVEARNAVNRLFWRYYRVKNAVEKVTQDAGGRARDHWIKSEHPPLSLPKKSLMVMALRELKKIEDDVTASSFTTAEATSFFDELGYETIFSAGATAPNSGIYEEIGLSKEKIIHQVVLEAGELLPPTKTRSQRWKLLRPLKR